MSTLNDQEILIDLGTGNQSSRRGSQTALLPGSVGHERFSLIQASHQFTVTESGISLEWLTAN
jgi:hypothetical protein